MRVLGVRQFSRSCSVFVISAKRNTGSFSDRNSSLSSCLRKLITSEGLRATLEKRGFNYHQRKVQWRFVNYVIDLATVKWAFFKCALAAIPFPFLIVYGR